MISSLPERGAGRPAILRTWPPSNTRRWLVAVTWLAASCAQSTPATHSSAAIAERLPQSPPAEAQPFAIARGDAPDLWKVAERKGELRRLARRSSMHYAFSPDSSHVVFLSRTQGLVAMRPDGTNQRALVSGPLMLAASGPDALDDDLSARKRRPMPRQSMPAQASGPLFFRFTPDARTVVYAAREPGGVGLLAVPLSGGSPQRLVDPGSPDIGKVVITPDSRSVLLSRIAQGVDIVPIDGKSPPRSLLGSHPLGVTFHVTPDSKHVVYRGPQHIHSIAVDGTHDRDLTPGLARADSLFLVPGGVIASESRESVRYAALDGSGTRQLMPAGLGYSWPPRPVGAGKGLAFHDHQFNLYHVDISSNVYRRINRPLEAGEQVSPFYASTSDVIVYAILRGTDPTSSTYGTYGTYGTYELYAADLNEKSNRLLAVADRTRTFIARPTADQRQIIIHIHTADDQMAFFRIDLTTGDASRLTPFLPGWSNFEISSDSRYLVFGVMTKPTQPRELDLHTLELPAKDPSRR